jgi:hypothetical protein
MSYGMTTGEYYVSMLTLQFFVDSNQYLVNFTAGTERFYPASGSDDKLAADIFSNLFATAVEAGTNRSKRVFAPGYQRWGRHAGCDFFFEKPSLDVRVFSSCVHCMCVRVRVRVCVRVLCGRAFSVCPLRVSAYCLSAFCAWRGCYAARTGHGRLCRCLTNELPALLHSADRHEPPDLDGAVLLHREVWQRLHRRSAYVRQVRSVRGALCAPPVRTSLA